MLDHALLAPETPQKISRELYERMVSLGLLDDARVELLHGTIIEMSPKDPPHASRVDELTAILVPALAKRARVRVPVAAPDQSVSQLAAWARLQIGSSARPSVSPPGAQESRS